METNLGKFTMKINPPCIVSCIFHWWSFPLLRWYSKQGKSHKRALLQTVLTTPSNRSRLEVYPKPPAAVKTRSLDETGEFSSITSCNENAIFYYINARLFFHVFTHILVTNLSIWYFVLQDPHLAGDASTAGRFGLGEAVVEPRKVFGYVLLHFFKQEDQLINNVYINISWSVYNIQTYQSMDFMIKKMWQTQNPSSMKSSQLLTIHLRRLLHLDHVACADTPRAGFNLLGSFGSSLPTGTDYIPWYHGIPKKQSTKTRRSEGLAFLNCFLGLKHGPDGPFKAQSKKAIATETWQRLRNDIRLYLSSAKINHEISWNDHQPGSNGLRMFGRHLHQPTALITVQLKTRQSYAAMPLNLS